jgi:acetyl esterase
MFKDIDIQTYRNNEKKVVDSIPKLFENISSNTYVEKILKISGQNTRIMVYYPPMEQNETLPVFVNLHGGGFVLGFAEVDDIYCRLLADSVQCVVVNVDYVLAPEHKFPSAVEECYQLLKWLFEQPDDLHIDPHRMAIGGHSAGGNITASVCLLAKERKEFSIRCQILDYAPLDLATSPKMKKSTNPNADKEKAEPFIELAEKYNDWYLKSKKDAINPLASPILADDLKGLPPALVITAEYDVLREEAELYARRMKEAGVDVTYKMYKGCHHGFTHRGPKEAANDAWKLMAEQLRKAFI